MKNPLLLILGLVVPLISEACPLHDKWAGVARAKFDYMIEVGDETTSTVTEESFNRYFFDIFFQNSSEMQKFPLPVVPAPDWVKPYFTAYTAEIDGVMQMGFWGGMARIPGMNDEGVAFITCHEVGHVLGGLPRFKLENFNKLSSEGQADFYATSVCLKNYFSKDSSTLDELEKVQTPEALKICSDRFKEKLDRAVCLRTLKSAEAFAQVLNHMQKEGGLPVLGSKDQTEVAETLFDQYPSHQCRLDTMVAGALGLERPKCWFRATIME